ncbi:hypothetical protein [Actinoplanes philippinensis]|uniref:hypothetical protein n=1 Tax=Actinoplanes philippinensis TaxID=35752 RepID=UPI0033D1D40C
MIGSSRRWVRPAVVAVLAAGLSSGCAGPDWLAGACTDRDEQFVSVLAELPILAVHPGDAELVDSETGCDNDSGFAHAGRQYRSGLAREAVMSFYRTAAPADGWRSDGEDPTPVPSDALVVSGAAACFSKEVDGATVHLSVWFPSDFNVPGEPRLQSPTDVFGLAANGSHDGAAWC